jgi:hypothetical protein
MRADRPRVDCRPTVTIPSRLGTHARLAADRSGNGLRFSAAKSPSSRTAADPYARIFGLSLTVLGAACLVLNAASPSTRIFQQSGRDFGATRTPSPLTRAVPAPEDGSHVRPFGTIRSKECATNEGGEESGY